MKLRVTTQKAEVSAELAVIDVSVEEMILRIHKNDKDMDEMKLRVNKQKAEVCVELAGLEVKVEEIIL